MNPVSKKPRDGQLVVAVNKPKYEANVCMYISNGNRYSMLEGDFEATHWLPYPNEDEQ
ncbi:MAG: hypothetical protein JJU10_05640 [Idiomarina sp.]|nr:hypothetical protein [Idiomarina sp.]